MPYLRFRFALGIELPDLNIRDDSNDDAAHDRSFQVSADRIPIGKVFAHKSLVDHKRIERVFVGPASFEQRHAHGTKVAG